MKRLFIIRHAKSDHGPQYQSDFERPLNQRGRKDARRMSLELKKATGHLDHLLVSSAKRTSQTAEYFMETFGIDPSSVTYTRSLYLPYEKDIWNEVGKIRNSHEVIAVFTHNPAAEELLHRYHPENNLPTCSIIEFRYEGENWKDISPETVRFITYKYPKMYDTEED